jgi:hypothetical protein
MISSYFIESERLYKLISLILGMPKQKAYRNMLETYPGLILMDSAAYGAAAYAYCIDKPEFAYGIGLVAFLGTLDIIDRATGNKMSNFVDTLAEKAIGKRIFRE